MTTPVTTQTTAPNHRFPRAEVLARLKPEFEQIADDASLLRPPWEPLLDSQRVVGAVFVLEDLFPNKRIPPDKIVRKGGYGSVQEALKDVVERLADFMAKDQRRRNK